MAVIQMSAIPRLFVLQLWNLTASLILTCSFSWRGFYLSVLKITIIKINICHFCIFACWDLLGEGVKCQEIFSHIGALDASYLELYSFKSLIVYNLSPELRGQLQKFSVALVHLPPLVVDVTVNEHVTQLQKEREKAESNYQAQVQELERRKVRNRGVMR